ncbi:ABC transporter permease subunit [Sulfitobacter sp. DSM 110093]|uniref:ABC transporter permease n=1 Tax=Sulfitobacter sp. DSM 110093 TaxID=2883127 RepID=UPI001FAD6F81|nr:ABC transporter permease subunit [Sulfitobacter sp. DSM 110093]
MADLPTWLVDYPESMVWELAPWGTDAIKYVVHDLALAGITLSEVSRMFAGLLEVPVDLMRGSLAEGFEFYRTDGTAKTLPPLPWPAVCAVFTYFAWRLAGPGLAFFTGFTLGYFLIFGLWTSAMLTLSSVIFAVLFSLMLGVLLGILGYRSRTANRILTPVYDVMQTIPTFSYLVPVLLLFGFNPVAAIIATVIYAMPPMARVTTIALQRVPENIGDFGSMAGCTPRQKMWNVLLPAARQHLLIGLNQVILLTFAMVIIASVIGAGGLGGEVYKGLKALRIGEAVEAGIAITLMAVLLDRLSKAAALKRPSHVQTVALVRLRLRAWLLCLLITAILIALAPFAPFLSEYPGAWTVSTGSFWDDMVLWISDTYYSEIKTIRDTTILYVMRPTKDFLLAAPWSAAIALIALLGWLLNCWRLALVCAVLLGFIVVTGYWDAAMTSFYLVFLATIVTLIIALPVGILAGLSNWADQCVTPVIDTLQTMPNFVYLIPVVMLFSVGEFSGLIAIVAYSLPPGIRYTKEGIRGVARSSIEAAEMSGCSRWQKLCHVQLPLAVPDILLGVNQTVMFAFGMLVITALVGTRGLEHDTLIAISKVQPGEGIVAGLGISFLSIIIDRLIRSGSGHLRIKNARAA